MGEPGGSSYADALARAVLGPAGRTDAARREAAFRRGAAFGDGAPVDEPEPLARLVDAVATRAWAITDADIEAARAAGASEDELFDLIAATAVGAGIGRRRAGLAAIDAWEARQ